MDKQLTNIGIIRESRNDENRTPLVPEHIKKYKESNPNINSVSYTHLRAHETR